MGEMAELLAQAKAVTHQEVLWRVKADPAHVAPEVPGLAAMRFWGRVQIEDHFRELQAILDREEPSYRR